MGQPGLLGMVDVRDGLPQRGQHRGQLLLHHLLDGLRGRLPSFDLGRRRMAAASCWACDDDLAASARTRSR